jgi:hypothetical protein
VNVYDVLADTLDDVADALRDAALQLRKLPPDDPRDDRRRAQSRDRMRRMRARNSDAEPRNSDALRDAVTRNESEEFDGLDGPRYADRPTGRSDRRNDGEPEQRVTVTRNSDANASRVTPAPPTIVREEPATRAERDAAQARIREMSEELRNRKAAK